MGVGTQVRCGACIHTLSSCEDKKVGQHALVTSCLDYSNVSHRKEVIISMNEALLYSLPIQHPTEYCLEMMFHSKRATMEKAFFGPTRDV